MTAINLFHRATDVVRVGSGETIFEAGDSADRMFVIVSGEVAVHRDGQVIEVLGCGDVLGELAFLDGGCRTASATARGECVLAPVDRRRFDFMVVHTPFFAQRLMQVLAERLRKTMVTRVA